MPQARAAPFITAVGDLESDEFKRQTSLIASQWNHGFREEIGLDGLNHLTICDAFGDPAHPLFEASCRLISTI
jgi:arylformamidase